MAIALGALTAIGQRLGVRPWLAALAALATGAVATLWTSAVVAEVNPLHVALMALLIHRSLVWADEGRARDLGLVGLLVGLGNHLLTLFVAPFFVVVRAVGWPACAAHASRMARVARHRGGRRGPVYLYIPVAASSIPPSPTTTR